MKQHKPLMSVTILLVIALGGIILYYNNQLETLETNYQTELDAVKAEYDDRLTQLETEVDTSVEVLNATLQTQETIFTDLITNVDEKVEQTEDNIIDLIKFKDTQNKQTISALEENLKDEIDASISSIDVKGGDFTGVVDKVIGSVVSIATEDSQGSGVFVGEDGFIVTNHHVVEDASTIRILTHDKKIYAAQLVGIQPTVDIAVLYVGDLDYKPLTFEDSVDVGEKVIALGNPGGFDFTVTEGIVSATNRVANNGVSYIQTDVSINPGNSGGPLVNSKGRIIGINTLKIAELEGIGFAISAELVEDIVYEVIDEVSD